MVPNPWAIHVTERPSQKSRPQSPPLHSEIIILEDPTCFSIKTLTNNKLREALNVPGHVGRCTISWEQQRLKWTDQPSVVTGSVWSSRAGLCNITQGSGSFWILEPTLGGFLHQQRTLLYSSLCCPIKKHYSPPDCWLRTNCIESTRFHEISVCQYGCPGHMYPRLKFYLLLVVQIHNFVM